MCGIMALYSQQHSISLELLQQGLNAQKHRGPDGEGRWLAPGGQCALGHVRLSIMDPAGGQQPMVDDQIAITVNGEFYDFESIRDKLRADGAVFQTQSDSEILLHLYRKYGTACLQHLRGEFAFVLWDAANQVLFAARDRFGIKPLVYGCHRESWYFASEAKALFAAGFPVEWDTTAYLQHLLFIQDQDRSLFRGIYQIPPGCYLHLRAGHGRILRYWDMDFPGEEAGSQNEALDDAVVIEAFRERMADAVQTRLRSDVPVGCYLSGGIDSSTVMSLSAARGAMAPAAFTVTFPDAAYNEGDIAAATADRCGAAFHPIPLDLGDIAAAYPEAVAHGESTGNMHAAARYLQGRYTRAANYKVVLTGDGADELLAGYSHFRLDGQAAEGAKVPADLKPVFDVLGFVPAWMRKLAEERAVFHVLLRPDLAETAGRGNVYRTFLDGLDVRGQLSGRHPLKQSLYLWSKSILPNYVLAAEKLEMAHAVETRIPYLDHHLFEWTRALPVRFYIRGNSEKFLLRQAATTMLPESVTGRQKHPFTVAPALGDTANPMYELLQDELRGETFRSLPFFDHAGIIALLDALPKMPAGRRLALDPVLMILLCTCFLQRRYRPGVSP